MSAGYQITDSLKNDGFSINFVRKLIERNSGNPSFDSHDFFAIIWSPTETSLFVEESEYIIKPNSFVFIGPNKKVRFTEETIFGNMMAMSFTSGFYEKSTNDSFFLNSELFFNTEVDVFMFDSSRTEGQLKQFVIDRLTLYKEKDHGLYLSVAHNVLEGLLLEGFLVLDKKEAMRSTKYGYIELVNKFRVLLQKHYRVNRSVGFYAALLNITPRRLSSVTEELLAKTAKQIIIEKIISEGNRLLKHSNLSIAEITYELGFSDEGNFSSFVKKQTGKNPTEIRQDAHLAAKLANG